MPVHLIFVDNAKLITQATIKCKICTVTNIVAAPFRKHCIACGQKLPRRHKFMHEYHTVRYNYHMMGLA